MVILTKMIDDIGDIRTCVGDSLYTEHIKDRILDFCKVSEQFTYQDLVADVLQKCMDYIPSPFSPYYPACYGLNLGNDFFTLRIPNEFGFGVRVVPGKSIRYEVSLVFYNNKCFIEESSYYRMLIGSGWKVKEKK